MNDLAHAIRKRLPDLGEQLQAQMHELYNDTSPDRCEYAYRALHEAMTAVRRLVVEIERGEQPTV